MWKWRAVSFLIVLIAVTAIIVWDSGWAKREASAAFQARFHKVPLLALDQQFYRGIICGTYQFPSRGPDRFVFVNHYSFGEEPEGLMVRTDTAFPSTASKLCPNG